MKILLNRYYPVPVRRHAAFLNILLDNYHKGILKHWKIRGYRRFLFECLYIGLKIAIPYDAFLKFKKTKSYGFKYTLIQPLHRFIKGESISIFWQRNKWNPITKFYDVKKKT